uniref:Phage protein n=1 Tax=Ascaris lumbricoides TaxID=6252 RepID=A0A0M3IJA9_ASCLU
MLFDDANEMMKLADALMGSFAKNALFTSTEFCSWRLILGVYFQQIRFIRIKYEEKCGIVTLDELTLDIDSKLDEVMKVVGIRLYNKFI